jgi:hypothetical protein
MLAITRSPARALDQAQAVVGVAREPMAPPLPFLVQLIQPDVGTEGG